MRTLSGFQAREVILLVQETDVSGAFAKLDEYGVRSPELETLRREFIHGRYDHTYYERLQMAVNVVANEHFETRTPDFDIFFSFSSKNLNAAVKEVQKLRDAGLKVFFSGDSLTEHAGKNFFQKVQNALESTQHFVLYATPDSLRSHWVEEEYETFYHELHMKDRENRRFFIVRGKGFKMDLLRPYLRRTQTSTTKDVIRSLRQQNAQGAQPKPKPKPPKPPLSEAERQRRRQLQQRIGGGVGALLLLLLLGYGIFQLIPTEAERWQEAKAIGTPEAIQKFIKSYPEGDYFEAAQQILDKLDEEAWETTSEANDLNAYQSYIKTFPAGRYFSEAKNKADSIAQVAEAEREARDREQQAFREATDKNTVEAYNDFLKNYSESEFAPEAEKRRNALNPPVITETVNSVSFDMVYVKGGTFTMGCTSEQSDCDSDEKPTHRVTVSSFRMSKYEVTNAQFCAFLNEEGNQTEGGQTWLDIDDSDCLIQKSGSRYVPKSSYADHPVIEVSWYGAQAYCEWLSKKTGKNYRLPTEAEWEFAARGGTKSRGYKYAGSNSIGSVAWYDGNSGSKTHPVGQKAPNELGLYDMSGNVWEWCQDWYGEDYYGSSRSRNPKGPSSGSSRVLRGGSWNRDAGYCRVAYRRRGAPALRGSYSGFRLAL